MNILLEFVLAIQILIGLALLGSSRLRAIIKLTAFQGILVGLCPLLGSLDHLSLRIIAIALMIIALKGLAFPLLLAHALRESKTSREVRPLVSYIGSLFVGVLAIAAAFVLAARLEFSLQPSVDLVVPVAFFLIITGLFLIIARHNAANQVLGYIVMENGIYTFGLAVVPDIPILVELGTIMDMFVAVFVMGIVIYRINQEFDHLDSDLLSTLKG